MELSSTISDTPERLIGAGDISIEPMAPHDDCETSNEPMFPVTQLGNIYQADDGLVVRALDRNGELNPGSTAFSVPVLFVDKFAVQSANLSKNKTGTLNAVDPGFNFLFLSREKIKTALRTAQQFLRVQNNNQGNSGAQQLSSEVGTGHYERSTEY